MRDDEQLPSGALWGDVKRGAQASRERAETDRVALLAKLEQNGGALKDARDALNISDVRYRKWREAHPGFAKKVDRIRAELGWVITDGKGPGTGTPRHKRIEPPTTFAPFRKKYFGFDSPGFHLDVIDALENSPAGSVTLILMPPEHGKTTLLEDFCCFKLTHHPNFRITIGSEKQAHGKKIIGRCKDRMTPGVGPQAFVEECGPFAPEPGVRRSQTWAEDRMNVYKKRGDERDFSMAALGILSSVVGTRTDLLIIDDIQSRKSLNATGEILANLQQDWLSRSGAFGRVVIIGTRVGPGDVYEKLENSPIVDRVIKYSAYKASEEKWETPTGHAPKQNPAMRPDHITTWLWPERYGPQQYLIMRVNAGEEGWNRNFMQRGDVGGAQPFKQQMLDAAGRAEFSVTFTERHAHLTGELVATVDPGFGVNCTMVSLMTHRFVMPIWWRKDHDLSNNQQIWQVLEEAVYATQQGDQRVTEVVLEDKAFQKGLLNDEGLVALKERFGFNVYGHQTGINKYDPDLGIPQMARSFERAEILFPAGPDLATKVAREVLDGEMVAWRPYKRGNRLTQDLVITLWFAWMTWRRVRDLLDLQLAGTAGFQTTALPSATSASGLHLPTGSYR